MYGLGFLINKIKSMSIIKSMDINEAINHALFEAINHVDETVEGCNIIDEIIELRISPGSSED